MKIGILTFHRAINYGAVLQCYALYSILKNMGHDVEVIDYRPESIEKYRLFFRKKEFQRSKGINKLRYLLSCIIHTASKRKISSLFDEFLTNHLKTSKIVSKSSEIPSYYNAIFFGSDQIWSPTICEGLDDIYLGQFPKGTTKYIAYAASLGSVNLLRSEAALKISNSLQVFDRISVREIQTHEYLKSKFSIDSSVVCDPTLLLDKSFYLSIAKLPTEKNYVLLFCLTDEREVFRLAEQIARQLNTYIISLKAIMNPLNKKSYMRGDISPESFIGYIQNALCVVTNSFHMTSFSILLEKDFYTISRKNNNERASTLLNILDLSERMIGCGQNIHFSTINYLNIASKLKNYRKRSMSYITDSIELCESITDADD